MPRLLAVSLLVLGCGQAAPVPLIFPTVEVNGGTRSDAGAGSDAGARSAAGTGCGTLPFGPDCCEGGQRITSATCIADAWTCASGSFCTCAGVPQAFQCAEFCGSDAFAPPECLNGRWQCGGPTRPTSVCPADTCWGEPGDCCGAPSCVDGGWVCGFRPTGC